MASTGVQTLTRAFLVVLQQSGCRHFQGFRDFVDNNDCRVAGAAFDATDIGPVEARFEGKILLGPALLSPEFSDVAPEPPPNIHKRRQAAM